MRNNDYLKVVAEQQNQRVNINGYTKLVNPSGIPDEYTELEYLESTGTQYIDTNINPSNYSGLLTYNLKFSQATTTEYYIFGALNSGKRSGNATSKQLFIGGSSNFVFNYTMNVANTIYNFEAKLSPSDIGNSYVKVNGVDAYKNVSAISSTNQPSANIQLFKCNGASAYPNLNGRVYSFSIEDSNGNYILNLIPAQRKADNVLGMYDLVSGTFLTNAGTGTFVGGRPHLTFLSANTPLKFTGDNILTYDMSSEKIVTFLSTDSSYKVLYVYWKVFNQTLKKGTYTLSYEFYGNNAPNAVALLNVGYTPAIQMYARNIIDIGDGWKRTYAVAEITEDEEVTSFWVQKGNQTEEVIYKIRNIQLQLGSVIPSSYEPYIKPLVFDPSPSINLNGINGIKDSWANASGKLVKRIGVVDLGGFDYELTISSGRYIFSCAIPDLKLSVSGDIPINALCPNYRTVTTNATWVDKDLAYRFAENTRQIAIVDNSYQDVATFKQAMSGVYLAYELAEPTTETTRSLLLDKRYTKCTDANGVELEIEKV